MLLTNDFVQELKDKIREIILEHCDSYAIKDMNMRYDLYVNIELKDDISISNTKKKVTNVHMDDIILTSGSTIKIGV